MNSKLGVTLLSKRNRLIGEVNAVYNKLNRAMMSMMIRYGKWIPDYYYLKFFSYLRTGKTLNLKNPTTFNEKINWLKIYDRRPIMTELADKYAVRAYVKEKLGEEYLIPLLWSGKDPERIPFDELPNSFVIKTNHASGTNIIVKNKEDINKEDAINQLKKWLSINYYYPKREWAYKDIDRKIVIEEFLVQDDEKELRDYRFFCFNGKPKFVAVDFNITDKTKTRRNLYDLNWNTLDSEIEYPKELKLKIEKPEKFEEMIKLSEILAEGFAHSRIDFYYIDKKILLGEITFYHQSGMGNIRPDSFDKLMGSWIKV